MRPMQPFVYDPSAGYATTSRVLLIVAYARRTFVVAYTIAILFLMTFIHALCGFGNLLKIW